MPAGQDPAGLVQQQGPAALQLAMNRTQPLADLVVDERLDRWADRLHWVEGRVGAARDAALVLACLPPEHVSRQVARVADRLGLPHAEVTPPRSSTCSAGRPTPRKTGAGSLRDRPDCGPPPPH